MFEVINKDGRILGLCRVNVPSALRHGDMVRVYLEHPLPEAVGRLDSVPVEDVVLNAVEMKLYEVALHDRRGPLRSRWYLMAMKDLPAETWKATNFIQLAWDTQR